MLMKFSFLFLTTLFSIGLSFGQSDIYNLDDNSNNDWTDINAWSRSCSWACPDQVPSTSGGDNFLRINGYTSFSGNMSLVANNVYTLKDTLYVDGDLYIASSETFNIQSAGLLVVKGNLSIDGNPNLANGGRVVVTGNLSINWGITVTNTSDFYVYGSVSDPGNGFPGTPKDEADLIADDSDLHAFVDSGVLPVEFGYLSAVSKAGFNLVNWETLSEFNNDFFVIEKSTDGKTYHEIGRQNGNGTSAEPLHYVFEDPTPRLGNNYYRIKQVDFDGAFSISKVVLTVVAEHNLLTSKPLIYPNPAKNVLNVDINGFRKCQIKIYNNAGKVVYSADTNSEFSSTRTIDVSNFAKGSYIVLFQSQSSMEQIKIIIQ